MEPDSWSVRRVKGRSGWYVQYRVGKSQKTRKLDIPDDSTKKAAKMAVMSTFMVISLDDKPVKVNNCEKPLHEWLDDWLDLEKGLCSAGSVRSYRIWVQKWLKLTNWTYPKDISETSSNKAYLVAISLCKSGAMQWKGWAGIRAYSLNFLSFLVKNRQIEKNPMEGLPVPSKSLFRKIRTIWREEEFTAVWRELKQPFRDWFWLMRYTGMDPADLASIRRFHVTRNQGDWELRKPRKKEERFPDAWIVFPLNDFVKEIVLEAWEKATEAEDLVFPGIRQALDGGHSLLYNRVRRVWWRIYPGRKFKNLKALRHTFGTWAIEEMGIPLDVVQDWLGHSPSSTVLKERYLHRRGTARYAKALCASASFPSSP